MGLRTQCLDPALKTRFLRLSARDELDEVKSISGMAHEEMGIFFPFMDLSITSSISNNVIEHVDDSASDINWVNYLTKGYQDAVTDEELAQIMIGIDSLAHKNFFGVLNNILTEHTSENMPKLVLLSILRVTSKYRNELKYWDSLRDKAIIWLSSRGMDPNKSLKGII